MMKYLHRFKVRAPFSSVAAFHQQPTGMGAITPPPVRVQLHSFPENLVPDGGEMDFTLWFGPLPIHWVAQLEDVSESGFTDRQKSGPFQAWRHRHSFNRIDDYTTEVKDEITYSLKPHLLWGPVGAAFAFSLPILFAFRGWRTRRLLEKGA